MSSAKITAASCGDAPHKSVCNGVSKTTNESTPMLAEKKDDNVTTSDDLNDGKGWMLLKALYRYSRFLNHSMLPRSRPLYAPNFPFFCVLLRMCMCAQKVQMYGTACLNTDPCRAVCCVLRSVGKRFVLYSVLVNVAEFLFQFTEPYLFQ